VAQKLLGSRISYPVDLNVLFIDKKPLFGHSKTIRGVISAVAATMILAPVMGFSFFAAGVLATGAMLGDLLTSFIKRRLGKPSSSMALGLDQIPESLFPMILAKYGFDLSWYSVALVVVLFFIIELLLSRILYHFHLRDTWY